MPAIPTLLTAGSLRLGAESRPSDEVPVEYITSWLKRRMVEFGSHAAKLADRVLIVRAETGSGKSTVLPVAVFRILRGERTPARERFRGAGVICTQPRVLTAIALASDVSSRPWNPDMVLGMTVGFQTGPVSNKPPAGLVYATAGVLAALLRSCEDGEIMERYRFIMIDEAHERSLDGDLMLMLLRNFYHRNVGNERLPFLMLTSATFATHRYAEYFGVGADNIVEVVGRAYPIENHWPERGTNDYPAEAAAVALRIHAEHADDRPERADILIFMPGAAETRAVVAALNRAAAAPGASERAPFLVLTINREVVVSQTGDYPLVFERPERLPLVGGAAPTRRIIVSTVVAETGLTIDTLRYVIDCGWSRAREVYQPWGADGLVTRPAPRSRIEQRRGRAGRLFPGDFYPLYTSNVHAALEAQQLPEIISTGVAEVHLAVVREQQRQKLRSGAPPEFRAEDMDLLDPPPPEAFLAANATAVLLGFVSPRAALPTRWPPAELTEARDAPADAALGALGARGYGLTALGPIAALFTRTPMEGVRVLLAGYARGAAASDLATAVAMFGTPAADLLEGRGREKRGVPPSRLPPGAEALRASLPTFFIDRSGGGDMVLPPLESEVFFFRARMLLADDFAESIFLFDAFARRLDAAKGDVATVAAWCADVGLSFEAMLALARKREIVIEEMILAGLNPFRAPDRRLSALSPDDFLEGLRALKQCLYDGLRLRLLRWDPRLATYVSPQGLRVRTPGLFSDAMASRLRALQVTGGPAEDLRPRWLVTDQFRLLPAPPRGSDAGPPLLCVADTGLVCVLDGYVDPDPEFDVPRAFGDATTNAP